MPIISFTPADALTTAVVPDGAYSCSLTELNTPKASSSGKSINYWGKIQITKGQFAGKEFSVSFNTETFASSLLGSTMFFPFGTLLLINAALTGSEVKPENVTLDTDNIVGKEFDAQIKKVINTEGQPGNLILGFLPPGKATSAPTL